ncbi:MAG TPA: DUF6290 family protein [Candidatus Acidoferrum sp.]|nr:DUF6290 family protein [Candidatus Acidoferrum sp.]
MTPKLPVVSGADLIRALRKFGYVAARQKGSHVRLAIQPTLNASPSPFPFIQKSPSVRFAGFFGTLPSPSRISFRRCSLQTEVHMLAIRFPQSIEKHLEKLARRTGRTKSFYVREAILEHLDELEDMYLAERALERIRRGEERTIPLEDALKPH